MTPGSVSRTDKGSRTWSAWIAWGLYLVIAIAMTWPLATALDTRLAGTDQDILNVYWGNWWVPKALFSGRDLYTTDYLIYPIGFDLTSFAFSPALSLLAMPLQGLFSSITAYNLVFLIVVVASCGAMDHLVRYLTGNPWAALVAGITFGFSPILAGHRAAHLNLAALAWVPWASLLLIRIMRDGRAIDALWLAIVARLAFLTRLQVGALAAAFCGLIFVGLAATEGRHWDRKSWGRLALAAGLALLLLSPTLLRIGSRLAQPDGSGVVVEASPAEADLLSYVTPMPAHPFFGRWTNSLYERFPGTASLYWTYLGFAPLALAVIALVRRPLRALPWVLAGLIFFLLALGAKLRFNGQVYAGVTLPYGWLGDVFAMVGFDRPDRFNLGLAPALAVLAGLGMDAAVGDRVGRPWVGVVVSTFLLFEYAVVPMRLWTPPPRSPFYDTMAADHEAYAIVDLPLTRAEGEVHRYYQTIHGRPIVGGWDHRVPDAAFSFIDGDPLLRSWRGLPSQPAGLFGMMRHLEAAGVRYIVLHKDQLGGFPAAMQQLYLAVRPVYEDDEVYVLPASVMAERGLITVTSRDGGPSLVSPVVEAVTVAGQPGLSWDTCWLPRIGSEARGSELRASLIDPEGAIITRKSLALEGPPNDPICQRWSFALGPVAAEGVYILETTMVESETLLSAARLTETVHFATGPADSRVAWLGYDAPTAFDAPLELLGYRIQAADDLLLVDTTWRGLSDHAGAYVMFMQVLDPVTRLPMVRSSDDVIPRLTWQKGTVVTDHRIIMVNDLPPGQYELAVGIYPSDRPGERIAAYQSTEGDAWPGGQVILPPRLRIRPDEWRERLEVGDAHITAYTRRGPSGIPAVSTEATLGPGILLLGYRVDEGDLIAGRPFDLTLYWQAPAAAEVESNYKVFVHVVDPAGRLVAQHDGDPGRGQQPTGSWQEDEKVLDIHRVDWLVPVEGDQVRIRVGMYDPQTMARLPVYGAGGRSLPDDQLELGAFTLQTE